VYAFFIFDPEFALCGGFVTPCHRKGVVFVHHSNEGLSSWWIFPSW